MNSLTIFGIIAAFATFQIVNSASILTNTGPAFEIKDGNCSLAINADLIFQDHHHKLPIPFVKRDATSHWAGDQKIYCVQALSKDSSSEGSTVEVTEGGVGHTFVTLKMKSKKSHGFEYDILVYAK